MSFSRHEKKKKSCLNPVDLCEPSLFRINDCEYNVQTRQGTEYGDVLHGDLPL